MGRGPKKTTSPLDRVYREIAVLKKLDHPNVVKLVEVLDDPLEDSLYLVFELVELGEILSIPAAKPLTEERSWSIFRDAVQGLEYCEYYSLFILCFRSFFCWSFGYCYPYRWVVNGHLCAVLSFIGDYFIVLLCQ